MADGLDALNALQRLEGGSLITKLYDALTETADEVKLVLRVRASVGADAKLSLRFNMPVMERVLEEVYAERVATAKNALGGFTILRAAD